jgi:shikimate dehydrogenase
VKPEALATVVPALFTLTNIIGALVTMPHKIATCGLVQRLSPTAAIAAPATLSAARPTAR